MSHIYICLYASLGWIKDALTLKRLVEEWKVDPNRVNSYGNTALLLAVRSTVAFPATAASAEDVARGVGVIEYLLRRGGDPFAKDVSSG